MGLDHCVFWGADYPHYDCTYPGAVTELEENLAPLALRRSLMRCDGGRQNVSWVLSWTG